jgi:MFS family permease
MDENQVRRRLSALGPRAVRPAGEAPRHAARGGSALALAERTRFSHAFEVPGYRWLWGNALCTSMTLTVELISQGWLILVLTQSPFWVGLAAGLRGASQTVFSLAGGAFADYVDRRRLLMLAQASGAALALVIAILVLSHAIRLWHVLAYVMLAGCAFESAGGVMICTPIPIPCCGAPLGDPGTASWIPPLSLVPAF